MLSKPKTTEPVVLLIDDNDIDNFINERMVKGCSFSDVVYINTSTRSAIEFLRNLASNPAVGAELYPTVIFLDINMPILDGFQFLAELEKFDFDFVKRLRVVMLTSSINPADQEKAMKSKLVTAFLHKPLTEEALQSLSVKNGSLV
jgi:CheY-like chemotaxis protein